MINLQSKADIEHANSITRSLRSLCIDFSVKKKCFECTSCPKKFTKPSSLKAHTFSHSKEKPHRCLNPGCDKAFSLPSNLRRHKKMVHMKASPTPTRRKRSSSRKLQSLVQYQSAMPEDNKLCPSSSLSPLPVWSPPAPSSSSSSSSSLPITKEETFPISVNGSSTHVPVNTNLPSSIVPNTGQIFDDIPIDPSCQPSLLPCNLTGVYIDPSELAVPNSPVQVTDDDTAINHSYFDNNNNIFPAAFNNQPFLPPQHLAEQDIWFITITTTLPQFNTFPF